MQKKKWLKISMIGFLVLLTSSAIFLIYLSKSAKKTWEHVQQDAISKEIHTDIDSFLEARSGQSPRLLDDFPLIDRLIQQSINEEASFYDTNQIEGLKQIPSISATMSKAEVIDELRSSMLNPPHENASLTEVCSAMLSVLAPINSDLEKWKATVIQAKGVSVEFFKNEKAFAFLNPCREISQLLLLRNYCQWATGSSDISDLNAVDHTIELLTDTAPSLITLSIAIVSMADINAKIISSIRHTVTDQALAQKLHTYVKTIDAEREMRHALQFEYVLQLSALQHLIDDTPFHFFEGEPYPAYLKPFLPIQRANLARDFKNYFIDSKSSEYIHDLTLTDQLVNERITNPIESYLTNIFFTSATIGISFYQENALKMQLLLTSDLLQSACILYKSEHGKYPNQLSDLVPTYLTELSTIPVTGKPYGYQAPDNSNDLPIIKATIPLPDRDDIIIPEPEKDQVTYLSL